MFDNIKSWDMQNYGNKVLFDRLVKFSDKLEICNIGLLKDEEQKTDVLVRDDRLLAVGIQRVNEFVFDIDDKLLKGFISNSYPYQLWDKFSQI